MKSRILFVLALAMTCVLALGCEEQKKAETTEPGTKGESAEQEAKASGEGEAKTNAEGEAAGASAGHEGHGHGEGEGHAHAAHGEGHGAEATPCGADCGCAGCAAKKEAAATAHAGCDGNCGADCKNCAAKKDGAPAHAEGATSCAGHGAAKEAAHAGCDGNCGADCKNCAAKKEGGHAHANADGGDPTSCAGHEAKAPADPERLAEGETRHFGDAFTITDDAMPIAEVWPKLEDHTGKNIKVSAAVSTACRKKGCWMQLEPPVEGAETVRVTFKDYKFFVPKYADGATAVMEGQFEAETISEGMRKHLAKDANMTQAEIDAIKGDVQNVKFVATAVDLTGPSKPAN